MTLRYIEYPADRLVELTVQGRVTRDDYDQIVDRIQAFIDLHGKIKVIEVIESFSGFDPAILLPGIRFDIRNIRHVSHVAVVSDIGWFSPVVKAAGALVSTKMRLFHLDELNEARNWIRSNPGSLG